MIVVDGGSLGEILLQAVLRFSQNIVQILPLTAHENPTQPDKRFVPQVRFAASL